MTQQDGETVDQFIARLRKQAQNCNFNDPDVDIRDQVIDKCRSSVLRRKLLGKENLTLTKVQDVARAMEAVDLEAKQMGVQREEPLSVHKGVQKSPSKSSKQPNKKSGKGRCYRCGQEGHYGQNKCRPAHQAECSKCKMVDHYAAVCKTKTRGGAANSLGSRKREAEVNKYLEEVVVYDTDDDDHDEALGLFTAEDSEKKGHAPIQVSVMLDQKSCEMQLDTGATASILPKTLYYQQFNQWPLPSTKVKLKAYNGVQIPVYGEVWLPVVYDQQKRVLPLIVVDGDGPPLLGRNWLKELQLNWHNIFLVSKTETLSDILKRHDKVFNKRLGATKGFKADIKLQDDAKSLFCKARPVPYPLRQKVEEELNHLESQGVVKKVEWSDWASLIVCVPKKDGSIRICGDFKVSINRVLLDNPYPLPDTEDVFATLGSKIDLSNTYQQMELMAESQHYLTVSTHKGLYAYQRLTYGIASAPAIFQSTMDQILQGMDKVRCRIDDILIRTEPHEHLQVLDEVLTRLEKHGILAKKSKCEFMVPSVEFLRYHVDREGQHPTDEKIAAIKGAPSPKNVAELCSYLGLLNYCGNFIPSLSTLLQPLHELLQKGVKWAWTEECEKAFVRSKSELVADKVLVPYD